MSDTDTYREIRQLVAETQDVVANMTLTGNSAADEQLRFNARVVEAVARIADMTIALGRRVAQLEHG